MKILLSLTLALFFGINSLAALSTDPPTEVKVVEVDFPLFKDMDNRIIYIDFELLNTNIKSLKIIRNDAELSFSDDVRKVEVDAIYEIDYTDYSAGTYELELETYSGEKLNSSFILE